METHLAVIILVMVLATQASRMGPMFLLSRCEISSRFEMWLRHVPITILAALIVPSFFMNEPGTRLVINYQFVVAGFAALLVGLKSKNLVFTTIVGVICMALLRAL